MALDDGPPPAGRSRIRALLALPARRLRSVRAEQWFFVGFVLLLILFAIALFVEPGSVGRGGR
jgi:hypothetical protein